MRRTMLLIVVGVIMIRGAYDIYSDTGKIEALRAELRESERQRDDFESYYHQEQMRSNALEQQLTESGDDFRALWVQFNRVAAVANGLADQDRKCINALKQQEKKSSNPRPWDTPYSQWVPKSNR